MFREITRFKQAIPKEDCIALLKTQLRGFLALLGDDDYPYVSPTNHYYNEEDGKLYFHSNMRGHKIDAMKKHAKASYCVLSDGYKIEGKRGLDFDSVIIFGHIEVVEDREKVYDICRKLSYQFFDDEEYIEHEIATSGKTTFMFALVPEHMTGKHVNEA